MTCTVENDGYIRITVYTNDHALGTQNYRVKITVNGFVKYIPEDLVVEILKCTEV